jgi:hypothetical protein
MATAIEYPNYRATRASPQQIAPVLGRNHHFMLTLACSSLAYFEKLLIARTVTSDDQSKVVSTLCTKALAWASSKVRLCWPLSSTRISVAAMRNGYPSPLAAAELLRSVLCVKSLMVVFLFGGVYTVLVQALDDERRMAVEWRSSTSHNPTHQRYFSGLSDDRKDTLDQTFGTAMGCIELHWLYCFCRGPINMVRHGQFQ